MITSRASAATGEISPSSVPRPTIWSKLLEEAKPGLLHAVQKALVLIEGHLRYLELRMRILHKTLNLPHIEMEPEMLGRGLFQSVRLIDNECLRTGGSPRRSPTL